MEDLFSGDQQSAENPLVSALRGRGWVPARRLAILMGINDRQVRAYAEQAQGEILSGQQGYRLIEGANLDDVDHASAWLISQGKKMIRRALDIKRRAHRAIA